MSAQAAQEPSMEDILASIRKIISEDGNEPPRNEAQPISNDAAAPVAGAHADLAEQNASAGNSTSVSQQVATPPAFAQSSRPPLQTTNAVERREDFSNEASGAAETEMHHATAPDDLSKSPPSALAAASQKAEIPGFIEPKPTSTQPNITSVFGGGVSDEEKRTETPLHPAISNAKEHVKQDNVNSQKAEKPVFQNSDSIDIPKASAPLVSPDSAERRDDDERRNHPLRRGADRDRDEFKNALMSPQTDDSVGNAFDELKDAAMDNLDGKVAALLRPMLREWLDNNLPSMVERLVRDEIERVSRGE